MRVRFSALARDELDAIYNYIAEHSPAGALRVKKRIREAAEQLGDFPYMARRTDRAGVRVRSVTPFPYLIFYSIRNDEVFILHIRHGARRPISEA
ncbi:MAG: type II toxin-antitoxin system RelE/ParE family toxin [Xanthobacteraceae bacterium]|nr:type II toxin-antitoxin system RelE/ParE family toxin [Xanthobacteraceae bacterium]